MDTIIQSNRSGVLEFYKKTDKNVLVDVNIILEWINKQPHFPKFNDNTLLKQKVELLLVYNKFGIEKTKTKLDMYFTLRNYFTEYYDNWDPLSNEFIKNFQVCTFLPLPKLTDELYRIGIVKFLDYDPDKFDFVALIKMFLMFFEIRVPYEYNVGDCHIYDCSGVTFKHITKVSPSMIHKKVELDLKSYSIKLGAVHLLYPPIGIDKILYMLKAFVKPKIYNKVCLHKDLASLHKVVPKELLPKDYGGNLSSYNLLKDQWYEVLKKNRNNLMNEINIKTDESKRLKSLNQDEIFGSMHGSFKKLDVD